MCLRKTLWGIAFGMVGFTLICGFNVTGGPWKQRLLRLDEQRLVRLRKMADTVVYYYNDTEKLPQHASDLVQFSQTRLDSPLRSKDIHDPQTENVLGYRALDKTRFIVCAEFQTQSSEDSQTPHNTYDSYVYRPNDRYELNGSMNGYHPKGKHCYTFTVRPKKQP